MSVTVSSIIDQVLDEIGDKDGHRTTREDALRYYNRAHRVLAVKARCLEVDAYFDILADEPRYEYPENATQISGIRLALTAAPTSLDDYYWLREAFREEHQGATNWGRFHSDMPSHYYARNNWIELTQTPVANVVDGGIVTFWKIPAKLVAENPADVIELPDFAEDHLIEGMKILARMTGRERDAAQSDWDMLRAEWENLREFFEDRARDRRPSLRPPGGTRPFRGMR